VTKALLELRDEPERVNLERTAGGVTALMLACRKGPSSRCRGEGVEDKVRTLLVANADVHIKSARGCVALTVASEAGNPRVVSMLLRAGADVKVEIKASGMTPLLLACQNGWTQTAEELLKAGADVNRVQGPGSGKTPSDAFPPIIYAAMNGHTSCVDMLIRQKANVNYAKADGFNALLLAAGFNQLDVVRRLVRAGASVEAADVGGRTPLLYSANAGQGPVVRALLQLGADPSKTEVGGQTALHLASRGGHSDVVSALLQGVKHRLDFDINALTPPTPQPAGGKITPCCLTALHLACENGNEKVVGLLAAAGADQRMRNSAGQDAFAIAKATGHAPVCQLLQPTRQQMITTFTKITDSDAFSRARHSLTVENVKALKRELTAVGVFRNGLLSTDACGVDAVPAFFARLSTVDVETQPALEEENQAMWAAGGARFRIATWEPNLTPEDAQTADVLVVDESGEVASSAVEPRELSPVLGLLGAVALPARHRFLLLKDDTSWHKFNVLVLGKTGLAGELDEAVALIEDMQTQVTVTLQTN